MRYLLILIFFLSATASFAEQRKAHTKSDYDFGASHVITFTPISGIIAFGEFNPGAGIDYEYIVSRKAGIGLHLPVMIGYAGPDQDTYYIGSGYTYTKHTTFLAAPGIRFHTGGRNSNVDFSTGPSILIGNIHFRQISDNTVVAPTPDYDYGMLGLVADNTLNFQHNHFLFGFNVRIGSMTDIHDDSRFFIQFGMQFGGRF